MKEKFSLRQLKNFRRLLENKKNQLLLSESFHEYEAFNELSARAVGEISTIRRHKADSGTRSFQQEVDLQLAEHESDEIAQILRAIERVKSGEYGQCVSCKEKILEKRLLAFPEAELCLTCKTEWENELRSRQKPNCDSGASPFNPLIDQVQKREFL